MLPLKRIVVAISGGVDSAVSTLILKKKGFDVQAVFMRNWDENESGLSCSSQDVEDAHRVCQMLNVPFHEVNFVKEYWNEVFSYMIEEYKNGCTPNPDIVCNKKIKFDCFYKYAMDTLGADAIATGHYARTSYGSYLKTFSSEKGVSLMKSLDPKKDQTFFLSQVQQEPLRRTMFPLSNVLKEDVKKLAKISGFDFILKKRESTGMCFIGKTDFQDFISEYIVPSPGKFIDIETGSEVGDHSGLHQWTIGQRCHIGGKADRYYVAKKDLSNNNIYVVAGLNHPVLYSSMLYTGKPYWINSDPPDLALNGAMDCSFKFQHTEECVDCRIASLPTGLLVTLKHPLRAITAGQFAVFYKSRECLGSARISNPGPSLYTTGRIETENLLVNVAE